MWVPRGNPVWWTLGGTGGTRRVIPGCKRKKKRAQTFSVQSILGVAGAIVSLPVYRLASVRLVSTPVYILSLVVHGVRLSTSRRVTAMIAQGGLVV